MAAPSAPAISVLIPARNTAATLDEALASIANQSFTDWEAIVVDDGSTDATPALLAARAARDPRFRILRNETGCGIVAALNRALDEALAPVLARMDADDLSLPDRFAWQWERISAGDVVVVGCGVRYFPEELVREGARRYEAWLNALLTPEQHERDLFVECPLAHPSMMLNADAVRAIGGYRAAGWAEDYDLLLRLWERGGKMAKIPETLLHWREGSSRTSRTHGDYSPEAFLRCKAHFLRRTHLAGERPALVFGAGPVGKAMARAVVEAGGRLEGFVDIDPRKVGQKIHGVPVLHRMAGLSQRGKVFGLAAVGRPGAREALREVLIEAGWVDGEDFRCVA